MAESFLANWSGHVVHRDLSVRPVPHLTEAAITARMVERGHHSEGQAAAAAVQDDLIEEFLDANASARAGPPGCCGLSTGGAYGDGTPNHGMDHTVPALCDILGSDKSLSLRVHTIVPELTMAPVDPGMAELQGLYEASLAAAHRQARELAVDMSAQLARRSVV